MSMTQTNIQWRRLWGIVAVQSSITLAWVIYSLYLPDLLVQLGFSKGLAGILLIIEHFLEVLIEPIFGGLSDHSQREIGTRFPWITFGVILASACFLALPMIAFLLSRVSVWRWIFPLTAILWASGMAMFRSPVVVLLGQVTSQSKLPIAASFLTLVQRLIGALRFTAYNFIVNLGPLFTFAIGSFVLLGAATCLRKVTPTSLPQTQSKPLPVISVFSLVTIVGTAISIGWGLRFLFTSLSQMLASHFGEANVSWGMLGFSLLLALTAPPAGQLASKMGNVRAMLAGLVTTAILLGVIASISSTVIFVMGAILMGFAFSIVLNGAVPLVLELVPKERSGLGIGIYFGSFGGAISFFSLFFARFSSLGVKVSLGAIALIIASFFIGMWLKNNKP